MHEEWQTRESGRPVTSRLPSSSWNHHRLITSALLFAVAGLTLGIGLAQLFGSSTVAARSGADSGAAVARADEIAPETEIADAVAAVRDGPFAPAPTEHLPIVQVSVSVCGARSTGSGVVVADGLLLTAAHVVGDAPLVRVDQQGLTVTGEVLGVLGDGRDVALIAVDAPMAEPVRATAAPSVGAPITLVGHPDGGPRLVAVGARVEVAPLVASLAGAGEILGVDIDVSTGISGGAAVDEDGALVGLVVAKEVSTATALVVALPDLADLRDAALVPGTCIESA